MESINNCTIYNGRKLKQFLRNLSCQLNISIEFIVLLAQSTPFVNEIIANIVDSITMGQLRI